MTLLQVIHWQCPQVSVTTFKLHQNVMANLEAQHQEQNVTVKPRK